MAEEGPTASAPEKLKFSVVMPAYNEEGTVGQTLSELSAYLNAENIDYEIVVVNDSSKDDTGQVIDNASAKEPRIRRVDNDGPGGYGNAIKCGLKHYKGDAMVIVTADGSDAPKDIVAYFRLIEEGYDCAFGSRFIEGATVTDYPRFKLFMNRVANKLIAISLGSKYNDFTNGFKCYRRKVVEDMQPILAGQFNITIELVVKAVLGGWRYGVVPTDWTQREAGESSFNIFKLIKPYAATFIYCVTANYIKNVKR